MKITSIKSHVLRYELEKELGYSQQYYKHRTAHLVEVQTDEGITGWGECFGPGNIALANKFIVEKVIQPLVIGEDPLNKEHIWQKVYNLLRDSGQKGMPIQALSGVDIALWDILGKKTNAPLYQLVGGICNNEVPVYGYGMMLQKKSVDELIALFKEESKQIKSKNFKAMKMKVGLGPNEDLKLVQAVRDSVGKDFKLMVDANHAYNLNDALYVGKGLDELDIYWFEEPVAPEDYEGYRELKQKISTSIAGGEAEFTKYGWNKLISCYVTAFSRGALSHCCAETQRWSTTLLKTLRCPILLPGFLRGCFRAVIRPTVRTEVLFRSGRYGWFWRRRNICIVPVIRS